MKVSIITVCYNSEATIEDTIKSVKDQRYKNIEYIIIDGDSKDNTNQIIRDYSDIVDIHISEKDKGLYDAMNKGINIATGDVIGILNSDDFFPHSDVISDIVHGFEYNTRMVYTDLLYVKENSPHAPVRLWKSKPFERRLLGCSWIPPHPTFYARRELFDELGGYDIRNKLAADYELLLRFFIKYGSTSKYLEFTSVHMRCGGESNNSWKNIIKQNKEVYSAAKKHNVKVNFLRFFALKFGRKVLEAYRAKKTTGAI
ncbi:glycosyltransferase family 2 protein [Vibrio splendidus]